MIIIEAKLIIEDVNNLSDGDAIETVKELISESFNKEERKVYPRCKLIFMEIKHKE